MAPKQQAPEDRPTQLHEERRVHPRTRVTVKVGLRSEHEFWAGFTEDISEGGVFVATRAPFDLGTEVDVRLSLSGGLGTFPIRCKVRWIRPDNGGGLPPGMGLEFIDLSPHAAEQIRKFIRSGRLEVLFWED